MTNTQIILTTACTTVLTLVLLAGAAALVLGSNHATAAGGAVLLGAHAGGAGGGRHDCRLADSGWLAAAEVLVERRLDLDASQQAAWGTVVAELREGVRGLEPLCQDVHARRASGDLPSAPDGLAMVEDGLRRAAGVVERVRPAFESFYASLSTDQRAELDAALQQRHQRRRGGWHH